MADHQSMAISRAPCDEKWCESNTIADFALELTTTRVLPMNKNGLLASVMKNNLQACPLLPSSSRFGALQY
jgi:hypothetical protein